MLILTGCEKAAVQEEVFTEIPPEELVLEDGENDPADSGAADQEAADQMESAEDQATVTVHVCGQVQSPGVYELPAGSRVYEALEAAGGLTEAAAGEYLNQARLLEDAWQVYVPTLQEAREGSALWQGSFANENAGHVSDPAGTVGTKVDLNRATKEELMTLTGIGEVKAEAILRYREEHGSFGSIEELKEIEGIKDGIFQKIRDDITV